MIRLPIEPLERWFTANYPPVDEHCAWHEANNGRPSANRMADVIGVGANPIRVWRERGMFLHSADKAAIALGTHPALIWDDWWDLEDWAVPQWFKDRRRRAVSQSWRLRTDCAGPAGTQARHMFNMPEPTGATAA